MSDDELVARLKRQAIVQQLNSHAKHGIVVRMTIGNIGFRRPLNAVVMCQPLLRIAEGSLVRGDAAFEQSPICWMSVSRRKDGNRSPVVVGSYPREDEDDVGPDITSWIPEWQASDPTVCLLRRRSGYLRLPPSHYLVMPNLGYIQGLASEATQRASMSMDQVRFFDTLENRVEGLMRDCNRTYIRNFDFQ